MRYRVKWKYASAYGGPWQPGDEVVLDEDVDVDLIQRDSGGVLEPVVAEVREQPPAQNRQLKRKATRQDRGAQEPITKDDFKAVRDE